MAPLTDTEKRVLDALCRSAGSNYEIGRLLYLEEDTIKSHLGRIFRKLGVSNRLQAILWGQANGYGHSEETAPILPFDKLSARQLQVVELAAQGKTNQEVADELHISPSTVKATLAQSSRILGEGSRQKIAMAYRKYLIDKAAERQSS